MKRLVTFLVLCGALPIAHASVHTLAPFQDITQLNEDGAPAPSAVGIDGNSIILVTRMNNGTRTTLWRQGARGRWAQSRVLSDVTLPGDQRKADVAMKNGIAAVRISKQRILIFERVNDDWTQTDALDNPDYVGGLAISGSRILLGATGCPEGTDAFVFEKNLTTGRWGVTGRIDLDLYGCDHAHLLDLNNSTAAFLVPGTVQVYRRNGSAVDWELSDEFDPPASTGDSSSPAGPVAIQGDVIVAPGNGYFRVDATGHHWDLVGRITPLDYWTGSGRGGRPVWRDGVLLNTDSPDGYRMQSKLYAYSPNAAGGFDHAAVLYTGFTPTDYDVSGRTVVVCGESDDIVVTDTVTRVFTLPDPLVGADAIAQDFETRDVSGITQAGNAGFGLAGTAQSMVLRSAAGGDAIAVLNGSNWRGYEYVEADVTPRAVASGDPWVGLALRYTDANNFYFASIHGSHEMRISRKVNGVVTTLSRVALPFLLTETRRFTFTIDGKSMTAEVTGVDTHEQLTVDDTTFGGGSVALLTSRARADFDNVLARQTARFTFADRRYDDMNLYGREWTFSGAGWNEDYLGLKQPDDRGSGSAVIGVPVVDQDLDATLRLDSFGSTNPVSSFAVMARYVDARTYYSLSVRSSGTIQLRKTVGGVTTVLRAANFAPGRGYRQYGLRVIGRELHGYVDGELVLVANDGDISTGAYGLSTYHAAISSSRFYASQP
jgi:hypothetical protein